MRILFLALLIPMPFLGQSQNLEQHVIGTGGEEFSSSTASLTWTLGETFTETYQANNHFLSQGFHQGVLIISSLPKDQDEGPEIKAYPNPVNDKLFVEIRDLGLPYQIIDLSGEILYRGNLTDETNEIYLGHLKPGVYFLSVNQKKTHKILKK